MVLANVVNDNLDRLRTVGRVEHHRLVEVHVLLRQVAIIHQQLQVGMVVFGVGLFRAKLKRSLAGTVSIWLDQTRHSCVSPSFLATLVRRGYVQWNPTARCARLSGRPACLSNRCGFAQSPCPGHQFAIAASSSAGPPLAGGLPRVGRSRTAWIGPSEPGEFGCALPANPPSLSGRPAHARSH